MAVCGLYLQVAIFFWNWNVSGSSLAFVCLFFGEGPFKGF
jgi:hypothetical protein